MIGFARGESTREMDRLRGGMTLVMERSHFGAAIAISTKVWTISWTGVNNIMFPSEMF